MAQLILSKAMNASISLNGFLFSVLQIGLLVMRTTSQDLASAIKPSQAQLYYPIQLALLLSPCFALPYQELLAMIPFVSLLSRPQGHADLLVSDWNNVCCDAGQDTGKQHQTDNPIRIKRFLSLGNPGIEHDPNRPITIYFPVPLTLWCSRNI